MKTECLIELKKIEIEHALKMIKTGAPNFAEVICRNYGANRYSECLITLEDFHTFLSTMKIGLIAELEKSLAPNN